MWMWTSVLRFIKELNVKSSVGARYYQLQVAEINPLESGEDSAFPAAAAAPRFPQQSSASTIFRFLMSGQPRQHDPGIGSGSAHVTGGQTVYAHMTNDASA